MKNLPMNNPSRNIRHTSERIFVNGQLYGTIQVSLNERSSLTKDEVDSILKHVAKMWSRTIEEKENEQD